MTVEEHTPTNAVSNTQTNHDENISHVIKSLTQEHKTIPRLIYRYDGYRKTQSCGRKVTCLQLLSVS